MLAPQIITSLSLINPVPNLTIGLSGAVPDPSTGKVRVQMGSPHGTCWLLSTGVHTFSAEACQFPSSPCRYLLMPARMSMVRDQVCKRVLIVSAAGAETLLAASTVREYICETAVPLLDA